MLDDSTGSNGAIRRGLIALHLPRLVEIRFGFGVLGVTQQRFFEPVNCLVRFAQVHEYHAQVVRRAVVVGRSSMAAL